MIDYIKFRIKWAKDNVKDSVLIQELEDCLLKAEETEEKLKDIIETKSLKGNMHPDQIKNVIEKVFRGGAK